MLQNIDLNELKDDRIQFVTELVKKGVGILEIVNKSKVQDLENIKPGIERLCNEKRLNTADRRYVINKISMAPLTIAANLDDKTSDGKKEFTIAQVYPSYASEKAVDVILKYYEANGLEPEVTVGGTRDGEIKFIWGSVKNKN